MDMPIGKIFTSTFGESLMDKTEKDLEDSIGITASQARIKAERNFQLEREAEYRKITDMIASAVEDKKFEVWIAKHRMTEDISNRLKAAGFKIYYDESEALIKYKISW